MKKKLIKHHTIKQFLIIAFIVLASCSSNIELTDYNGSDFSFSYPVSYDLKRAATRFAFEDAEGNVDLTMYRYLANDPDEVILQMASVSKTCKYEKGGTKYGGYKAYTVIEPEGENCDLGGTLVGNGDGMMVLIILNNQNAEDLNEAIKDSFEFAK